MPDDYYLFTGNGKAYLWLWMVTVIGYTVTNPLWSRVTFQSCTVTYFHLLMWIRYEVKIFVVTVY